MSETCSANWPGWSGSSSYRVTYLERVRLGGANDLPAHSLGVSFRASRFPKGIAEGFNILVTGAPILRELQH